ncbi:hypothetical protein AAC387_Pa03g4101 [Persea americana]
MQPSAEISQRISRISAHLRPPALQMEESSSLRRSACRAKGGTPGFKVAILGAAGGVGQPLAMLMKMNPLFQFYIFMMLSMLQVLQQMSVIWTLELWQWEQILIKSHVIQFLRSLDKWFAFFVQKLAGKVRLRLFEGNGINVQSSEFGLEH